jgi:hypothetical protein
MQIANDTRVAMRDIIFAALVDFDFSRALNPYNRAFRIVNPNRVAAIDKLQQMNGDLRHLNGILISFPAPRPTVSATVPAGPTRRG